MSSEKCRLRVLHAASLLRPSAGQIQQMTWEQSASDELGLAWTSRMYCPSQVCGGTEIVVEDECFDDSSGKLGFLTGVVCKKIAPLRWLRLRVRYHRWLKEQASSFDVLIMRYYVHDPVQWFFVRRASIPIIFYSHTLEVPELRMAGGLSGFVRATLESVIGPECLRSASGVVGVTSEVINYQLSRIKSLDVFTYEYPNGVMDIPADLSDDRVGQVPELLFVANFLPWHGLDNLIQAVKFSDSDCVLHVVGIVPDDLLALAAQNSRIVFHGQLGIDEIFELSKKCWIGISSLRLDRKGAEKAATLKAPLYLSFGLPVYGCGDVLPSELAHYCRGGPNLEKILDFAKKSKFHEKLQIQRDSLPYIDKRLLLSAFYEKLEESFN